MDNAEIGPEPLAFQVPGQRVLSHGDGASFVEILDDFVGSDVSLEQIVSRNPEATSVSFVTDRDLEEGVPEGVATLSLNEKGQWQVDFIPIEGISRDKLEQRIENANVLLEKGADLKGILAGLFDAERGKKEVQARAAEEYKEKTIAWYRKLYGDAPIVQFLSKFGMSNINELNQDAKLSEILDFSNVPDFELVSKIVFATQKALHEIYIGKEDETEFKSYRLYSTGGENELGHPILVRDDHVEAQQNAVKLALEDIAKENPSMIIMSGRGGWPYRSAAREAFKDVDVRDVRTSTAVAGPRGRYAALGDILNEAVDNHGDKFVRVVVVEGAEYSGSSITNLFNYIGTGLEDEHFSTASEKILEIVVYSFTQNEKQRHFANLNKISIAKDETIRDKNIRIIHKRIDLDFVLGEDAVATLGEAGGTRTDVNAQVPLLIFDAQGNIVEFITPEMSAAESFSELLGRKVSPDRIQKMLAEERAKGEPRVIVEEIIEYDIETVTSGFRDLNLPVQLGDLMQVLGPKLRTRQELTRADIEDVKQELIKKNIVLGDTHLEALYTLLESTKTIETKLRVLESEAAESAN